MGSQRPGKRVRADDLFFEWGSTDSTGSYLRVRLLSGKPFKSRGWPWVQMGIRGVLGMTEKLEKASFLGDGNLLIKTKTVTQTEKFLKTKAFATEECEIIRDKRLNTSRGTIRAYDLEDLTDDEVAGWLRDFGVIGAKRFTRRVNGKVENTPTILLTFDKPTCPAKLELDYVTYHVHHYVPNPMMCFKCGRFGHTEERCQRDRICLKCGQGRHEGECAPHCVNCQKTDHSCQSRQCEVWVKEKEICRIKVEQEISFIQARQQYETLHEPPVLRAYAATVRTTSAAPKPDDDLKEKVGKLERKVGELVTLLHQLLRKETTSVVQSTDDDSSTSVVRGKDKQDMDEGKMTDGCVDIDIIDDGLTDMTSQGGPVPPADWVTPGKGNKGKDKLKGRATVPTTADDDITPSPLITRASRPPEKVGGRLVRKQSWKDLRDIS